MEQKFGILDLFGIDFGVEKVLMLGIYSEREDFAETMA